LLNGWIKRRQRNERRRSIPCPGEKDARDPKALLQRKISGSFETIERPGEEGRCGINRTAGNENMNDLISQNPEMEQLIEAVFQIKDQLQGDYYEEDDIQNITECIQKFTAVYESQTETMNDHLEKITKVLADISAQIYNLQ
jgi:hypothetical protein